MLRKFTILWIAGLLTLVPYGIYYLLFEAARDEYALWITLVLFWIFGYWGVIGPIVSAIRVHGLLRALEVAGSGREIRNLIESNQSREAIIDLIVSENRVPRFVAVWAYKRFKKQVDQAKTEPD